MAQPRRTFALVRLCSALNFNWIFNRPLSPLSPALHTFLAFFLLCVYSQDGEVGFPVSESNSKCCSRRVSLNIWSRAEAKWKYQRQGERQGRGMWHAGEAQGASNFWGGTVEKCCESNLQLLKLLVRSKATSFGALAKSWH